MAAEIKKQSARKSKYESLRERLDSSDQEQISTSDPDSRQMIIRNNITEVAYNIQSTTDARHHIPIDFKVTNNNDSKAMGNMVRRAKSILHTNHFTALFDKDYHTGSEIKTTVQLGVEPIVAIPAVSGASMAPDPAFNVSEFTYDPQTRTYTCPQGSVMSTNGTWYKKVREGSSRKSASPGYNTSRPKTAKDARFWTGVPKTPVEEAESSNAPNIRTTSTSTERMSEKKNSSTNAGRQSSSTTTAQ